MSKKNADFSVVHDQEALQRELFRLAIAEGYLRNFGGPYSRLVGLSELDAVEKYLEAFPTRRRWRDRQVADNKCRAAALVLQDERLALVAKHQSRARNDGSGDGDWMAPFVAPGVPVQFTALHAIDEAHPEKLQSRPSDTKLRKFFQDPDIRSLPRPEQRAKAISYFAKSGQRPAERQIRGVFAATKRKPGRPAKPAR